MICQTILDRKAAREAGLKRYFIGQPCANGHIAERFVSTNYCLECAREYRRRNRQEINKREGEVVKRRRAENPDKFKEYNKRYYAANAEKRKQASRADYAKNAEKRKETHKKWVLANLDEERRKARERARIRIAGDPAANRAHVRAWAAQNREYVRDKVKRWRADNPEKAAETARNKRAKRRNASGSHTQADVNKIRTAQKDKCAICKIALRGKGHVDHIIPLARNGRNDKSNLQILCAPCNCSKHARDPIEFMQSRGFLI